MTSLLNQGKYAVGILSFTLSLHISAFFFTGLIIILKLCEEILLTIVGGGVMYRSSSQRRRDSKKITNILFIRMKYMIYKLWQ